MVDDLILTGGLKLRMSLLPIANIALITAAPYTQRNPTPMRFDLHNPIIAPTSIAVMRKDTDRLQSRCTEKDGRRYFAVHCITAQLSAQ
jgi:hypothetical protein